LTWPFSVTLRLVTPTRVEGRATRHRAHRRRRATRERGPGKAAIEASEKAVDKAAAAQQRAEESERETWRTVGEHESERGRAEQNAAQAIERATTAERDQALAAAKGSRAETTRVREELTAKIARQEEELAAERAALKHARDEREH
jgi:hypothetical protein